ncbi:unnamed protein product [Prorocentrum cordatum]|uniref:Uncharacterized protein n=1 Tax=Prorocentrum cordatum TaxID=2364126 RepID=A0ABN9U530_9DINO|nr:unnamed protein product [Polarella glacialis]
MAAEEERRRAGRAGGGHRGPGAADGRRRADKGKEPPPEDIRALGGATLALTAKPTPRDPQPVIEHGMPPMVSTVLLKRSGWTCRWSRLPRASPQWDPIMLKLIRGNILVEIHGMNALLLLTDTLRTDMQAMLQSCIRQATDAIAATSMAQVTSCQTQLVRMFQTQQEAVNRSLAVQTRDIAAIGQRADALEAEQAAMRKQIGDINKVLAIAEKELPLMDFQELEAWGRQPNPRVFSIGAPQLVGPAQALQGLEDWIRAAGLTNDMVCLDPAVPSKRFNVLVQGGDSVALPRAQALARQLRDPAGRNGWRAFCAQSVGGGTVPLYISPDKSPQQVRMEIQSRRLSTLLAEAYPGISFSAQRARGIVTSQGVNVAKLEMGESRHIDTIIRWNPDMVARLHIDRESINAQFKKAFSVVDNTEWI